MPSATQLVSKGAGIQAQGCLRPGLFPPHCAAGPLCSGKYILAPLCRVVAPPAALECPAVLYSVPGECEQASGGWGKVGVLRFKSFLRQNSDVSVPHSRVAAGNQGRCRADLVYYSVLRGRPRLPDVQCLKTCFLHIFCHVFGVSNGKVNSVCLGWK